MTETIVARMRDEKLAYLYRQAGDPEHFNLLCERHRVRLRGVLIRAFPNITHIDYGEVIAEVFEFLYDFLKGAKPLLHIGGWLNSRVQSHFNDKIRASYAKKRDYRRTRQLNEHMSYQGVESEEEVNEVNLTGAEPNDVLAEIQPTGLETVIRNEEAQLLHTAINTLPRSDREVILCKMEGMTDTLIASNLSIPIGTVKSAYHRAYATLRSLLRDKICVDS